MNLFSTFGLPLGVVMKLNLLISFGSSLKEHIIIMGNSLGKRLVVVYCILYIVFVFFGGWSYDIFCFHPTNKKPRCLAGLNAKLIFHLSHYSEIPHLKEAI